MSSEKRFDATATRLDHARREGDLPHSGEAVAVASFALGLAAVAAIAGPASDAARTALGDAARGRFSAGAYFELTLCALAPAAASLAGAIAVERFVASGFAFRAPRLEAARLNPFSGMKRLCSRDALVAVAKAALAAPAIALALRPSVLAAFVQASRGGTPVALAAVAARSLAGIAVAAVGVALVFALFDVGLQRARWRRRLRMDFEELKRDLRQNEGDPLLRGRRRKAHGALLRGSLERVREAAFVVVNPTHVAIALAYAPPRIAVPHVVARAVNEAALLVKRRANDLGIPVIEDASLARALFAVTRAGASIPRGSYDAVARIVAALISAGKLAG